MRMRIFWRHFARQFYTSLRQNGIRNELREILKAPNLTDEDLLMHVSRASSNEEERLKKLNGANLWKLVSLPVNLTQTSLLMQGIRPILPRFIQYRATQQ